MNKYIKRAVSVEAWIFCAFGLLGFGVIEIGKFQKIEFLQSPLVFLGFFLAASLLSMLVNVIFGFYPYYNNSWNVGSSFFLGAIMVLMSVEIKPLWLVPAIMIWMAVFSLNLNNNIASTLNSIEDPV